MKRRRIGVTSIAVLAYSPAQIAWFLFEMVLIFAGLFVIAVLTPKLAAFIDKKRAQAKSPFEKLEQNKSGDDTTDINPADKNPAAIEDKSAADAENGAGGNAEGGTSSEDSRTSDTSGASDEVK